MLQKSHDKFVVVWDNYPIVVSINQLTIISPLIWGEPVNIQLVSGGSTTTPINLPTATEFSPTSTTIAPNPTTAPSATPVVVTAIPTSLPPPSHLDQIAFVSERIDKTPQIFLMNADGSNPVQLTEMAGGACQPVWSPDGAQLLFISPCSKEGINYPKAAIYLVAVPADPSEVLPSPQPLIVRSGGVFDADWSPNGILFTSLEQTQPLIYWADVNGKNIIMLSTDTSDGNRQAKWSKDDKIAFVMDWNTSIAWAANKDGVDDDVSRQSVTSDVKALYPAWSPEGDKIAYATLDDKNHPKAIYVVDWNANGFDANLLTNEGMFNRDPDWSSDGLWIVYASFRQNNNERYDIYKMLAGGGSPQRLTNDSAYDYQPAWRP